MKTRFAQKAFVFNEDQTKLLFLKRAAAGPGENPIWDIPGGGLEFGEQPLEAIERELMEEVALSAESFHPLTVWTFFPSDAEQVIGVTYLAEGVSGDIVISDEHADIEWLTPQEVLDNPAIKTFHKDVEALIKYLG